MQLASQPNYVSLSVKIVSLCVVFGCALLGNQAQADRIGDWVLHESTGRAFGASIDGNEVIEFEPSGEVQRFQVGANPTELIIKKDLLVVGCTKSPSLHIVNLKTNQKQGIVQIDGKGPYALFASKADDPYVYCVSNTGDAWWDGEVFQIDLGTLKVRKRTRTQGWGQSHPINIVMSPDGKWIVPDARGRTSPSGADLMKVNAEELLFQQMHDYHSSFGIKVPGPNNRYWTFGGDLYTLDIKQKIRKFSGDVCAIHPSYDLVAAFSKKLVVLEKLSDAEEIGRASVSVDGQSEKREYPNLGRNGPSLFDPTIQFDLANDRVFVGGKDGCDWVDLNGYRHELQPLRVINAPSSVSTLIDKPMRIPVSMTNPDAKPTASLVVDDESGAKIVDGHLVWTPTAKDLGDRVLRLAIKSSDGRQLDRTQVKVEVTLPLAELDFDIKSMRISPSGRTLAVWGAAKGQESRHPAHAGPDGVAVINLQNLSIIAQKTIPQGVRDLEIDDNFVFLAPASGNLVYRLDHKLNGAKRQFLKSTPKQILKISPQNLAVFADQLEVFDVQEMVSAKIGRQPMAIHSYQPTLVTDVATLAGRVVKRSTGELLRVTTLQLPILGDKKNANLSHMHMHRQNNGQQKWGRILSSGTLSGTNGSRISQQSNVRASVMSDQWPIGIMLSVVNEGRTSKETISFCDLVDGTIKQTSVIRQYPNVRQQHYYGLQTRLVARGKQIYIASGDRLLVAEIPDEVIESVATPVHFLDQQKLQIPVGKVEKFTLGVGGSRKGATFSLLTEYSGIKLDEATGEVSVDTQQLWANFVNASQFDISRSGSNSALSIPVNAGAYKAITGRDLPEGKIATQLPIHAALVDQEGQEDRALFFVVVVGPRKPLDDAKVKREQERAKQMEIARKQQAERQSQMQAAREAAASKSHSVEQRLDDLEARMRRIEAALDSVLKKLDE